MEIQSIVIENKSREPYFKIKKEVRLFEQVRIQWMQQTIDLLEQLATTDVLPAPEILSY